MTRSAARGYASSPRRSTTRRGLDVDITAGSSPTPVTIDLPAGKFGRPALVLREGWTKKGVAVSYLNAVDRKSLLLFGLILVVCVLFLTNGALAATKARPAEVGILLTIGWSRGMCFAPSSAELVIVGAVAGFDRRDRGRMMVKALALSMPVLEAGLVFPLAVGCRPARACPRLAGDPAHPCRGDRTARYRRRPHHG